MLNQTGIVPLFVFVPPILSDQSPNFHQMPFEGLFVPSPELHTYLHTCSSFPHQATPVSAQRTCWRTLARLIIVLSKCLCTCFVLFVHDLSGCFLGGGYLFGCSTFGLLASLADLFSEHSPSVTLFLTLSALPLSPHDISKKHHRIHRCFVCLINQL